MTIAGTPRHPWELLLEQLSGRMNVRHGFGTREDAQHTSIERVVWIPSDLELVPARFDLANATTPYFQHALFDVSIYGGSPLAVYDLHAALGAWLDLLAGPRQGGPGRDGDEDRPGYDAPARAKVAPRGGDGNAQGWGTICVVGLYRPASSIIYPLSTITSVSFDVAPVSPEELAS